MLGEGKYATLTGTSVAWDFVELPSQFMENWCFEATELKQWARHYTSGEPMPDSIITNIKKSQKFLEGMATIRQIGLGLLDMAWHNPSEKEILNYKKLEESIFSDLELWSKEPGVTISTAFSHIFSGGYSAGYYSYKWSEVLDADAFSRFSNKPDNSEVAQGFKKLLKAGGSIDPSVLFKNFMGREPNINALLTRAGIDE
jgi:peptidyl-dipeptidase Dcp